MENIILVKNEHEIQILHAKNTPMAWDVGNTRGGPLPLPAMFSCAFEAWHYASGNLLCFCVRKKALLRA